MSTRGFWCKVSKASLKKKRLKLKNKFRHHVCSDFETITFGLTKRKKNKRYLETHADHDLKKRGRF